MTLDELTLLTPYLELDALFYDCSEPLPLENAYVISLNTHAAELLGVDFEDDPQMIGLMNGVYIPKGGCYYSMCYAGHQFGHYQPRLGDGRVHNLGKVGVWNLQLKGSGETRYARMADGRATVRSSIREYLMSEAMHHLGVATTRALGVIGSQTKIVRTHIENAAIVLRLSTSWIRFGSFEYFYYAQEHDKLKALAQYVIEESYTHLKNDTDRFFKMFCEILERTAILIAQWQALGFCHGVLNTDNMSISGLTIDYGPFSMMDDFDYGYVCNHTDKAGRYAYGEQPNVAYWNLTMLAKALSPLIDTKRMQAKLDDYGAFIYPDAYVNLMREKLGLKLQLDEDVELIKELVGALHEAVVDYTLFFRTLSHYDHNRMLIYDIVANPVVIDHWLILYDARLEKETQLTQARHTAMRRANPKYVLKNYMLEEAVQKAHQGDFTAVETLLYIAAHPYEELPQYEHYAGETPAYLKNRGLSCAS